MDKFWTHAFQQLDLQPRDHPLLLTDFVTTSDDTRKVWAEKAFESLGVPGLTIATDALLALFATGRTTGVVVDVGYTVTDVVPISNGAILKGEAQRLELGGKDVVDRLVQLLMEAERAYWTVRSHEAIANGALQRFGFVSAGHTPGQVCAPAKDELDVYELPDGEVVRLGDARLGLFFSSDN